METLGQPEPAEMIEKTEMVVAGETSGVAATVTVGVTVTVNADGRVHAQVPRQFSPSMPLHGHMTLDVQRRRRKRGTD